MNQVPHGMHPLSEKDLAYTKDMISWELVATKKAFQYAHQTMEPECRQLMFHIAQQHQRNLERILQHLAEHLNQPLPFNVAAVQATGATQTATASV